MAWVPCRPREQPRYVSLQLTRLPLSPRQRLLRAASSGLAVYSDRVQLLLS